MAATSDPRTLTMSPKRAAKTMRTNTNPSGTNSRKFEWEKRPATMKAAARLRKSPVRVRNAITTLLRNGDHLVVGRNEDKSALVLLRTN
jgi:hypothetical protein